MENNKPEKCKHAALYFVLDHKHVDAVFCSKPSITSNHRASVDNYGRGGIIDLVAIVSQNRLQPLYLRLLVVMN